MTEKITIPDTKNNDISLILRDLLKVIKVVSMYPEDNPLPQSLRRSFAEKLVEIVETYGDIDIKIAKTSLKYDGEVVFTDRSKEESLAGIFFGTGMTSFTFKAGLDVPEVYNLLDILKEYQNSPAGSLDLVTMIWEANLSRFKFTTIEDVALADHDLDFAIRAFRESKNSNNDSSSDDDMAGYHTIFSHQREENFVELKDSSPIPAGLMTGASSDGNTGQSSGVPSGFVASVFGDAGVDASQLQTSEAEQAMGYGDLEPPSASLPNAAMIMNDEFRLSTEEEDDIAVLLREDAEFDIYESTVEILKELIYQETEMVSFKDTITICEKINNELLQAGKLLEAAQLLKSLHEAQEDFKKKKPLWAKRIKEAFVAIGSRDQLKVLTDALNDHPEIGTGLVRLYLENFGWEILSGVVDLLGDLQEAKMREAVCDYLAAVGKDKIHIISKGLSDRRVEVICNTVTVMARIATDEALHHLKKATSHPDSSVRLQIVDSLKDIMTDQAITLLKLLACDSDRKVRQAAIRTISNRQGQSAFDAITEIINTSQFSDEDIDNQQLLLNAFSTLGGEQAVSYLAHLILRKNLLGNSNIAFYRSAAFEALSLNRSEKAEQLLVKLTSSWRTDIRQQARYASQKRRSMIYGGEE